MINNLKKYKFGWDTERLKHGTQMISVNLKSIYVVCDAIFGTSSATNLSCVPEIPVNFYCFISVPMLKMFMLLLGELHYFLSWQTADIVGRARLVDYG